jgi:hypothetical protein
MNDGWDLDVGDLVTVLNGDFARAIGIVTMVSVPRKQWFIHWLSEDKRIPTMCMYTYIKPLGGDNENR